MHVHALEWLNQSAGLHLIKNLWQPENCCLLRLSSKSYRVTALLQIIPSFCKEQAYKTCSFYCRESLFCSLWGWIQMHVTNFKWTTLCWSGIWNLNIVIIVPHGDENSVHTLRELCYVDVTSTLVFIKTVKRCVLVMLKCTLFTN